jgi:hypothetical protein
MEGRGPDVSGSGRGHVTGAYEHVNEYVVFIKCGELPE